MKKIIVLIFGLMLFACNTSLGENSAKRQPNILLIIVDDQGYADFEPFANQTNRVASPNITALANSGVVFTQAYVTAPVCSPSRAGLLTGKNQFRWDKPASWGPGLPDTVKTVAEYLQTAGYTTARIGKNDLGRNFHKHGVREYPLNHGYDEFLGFCAHAHDYWLSSTEIRDRTPDPSGTSAALGPLMHNEGEKSFTDGYLTDIFSDEAIKYIQQPKEKPFFLTLSYTSVHHLIHEVPKKYLDKFGVEAIPNYDPDDLLSYGKHAPGSYAAYYDKYSRLGAIQDADLRKYYLANLNCLDDNIGRVMGALEASGQAENTLVIYLSDNGGSPLTGSNNAPLTGGKYSLWEGGIRVPLALSWPGNIEPGTRQTAYVSMTDILPTVANVAGIELNDPTIDGVDLRQPQADRLLVWKWQKTWAVRQGDWKLTNANENHWKSRPSDMYIKPIVDDFSLKLFNLADDPGERQNLADQNPDQVKALEQAYQDWCKKNLNQF